MIQPILDHLSERVKNPWLGSIFFVSIAINWQPLMYLFFADKDLEARFDYFHENTTLVTLLCLPIVVGVVLSVAKPILSFAYYWITKHPNQWNQSQFWQQKKSNLEQKISFEKAAQEFAKVRSETEKITKNINDLDTQEEIKQILSEVRDGDTSTSELPPNLNAFFKENELPDRRMPDLMRGAAQYLTEYDKTFTKEKLFGTAARHKNWVAGMNRQRSRCFNRLIDNGKIIKKFRNNFKYNDDLET